MSVHLMLVAFAGVCTVAVPGLTILLIKLNRLKPPRVLATRKWLAGPVQTFKWPGTTKDTTKDIAGRLGEKTP